MISVWPTVALGELLTQYTEYIDEPESRPYPKLSVKLYGKGVVMDAPANGASLKMQRHQLAKAGQVILSEIWGKKGAIGIVPPEGEGALCTSHFFLFDIRHDLVDPRWLQAVFSANYLHDQLDSEAHGTTGYAAVRPKHLLAATIPLPPMDEQRRIVARIAAIAARIEEARGLRRAAMEEASTLPGMIVSEIIVVGEAAGWETRSLGDYVLENCYGTSDKTSDDASGTPILRMGNIQNGQLDIGNLKYLHLDAAERERLCLQRGDILVNRTNSAELVGKCAVFDLEGEFGFASYVIRLRLDRSRADPNVVAAYINSPRGRAYMFKERKQMTGQANVNASKLKAMPIALPSIDEQRIIVDRLHTVQAQVDALKRLQAESAAELEALLPSVLDRAFRGEL